METVVSGIRSTGNLHLGNYFGALKNFIKMQHENNCYFFIADYHSLTTHPTPADLHGNVKQVLAEYLACGLDPEVSTIYVQSDVPEVSELYLLLNMNAYIGELERTTSFKDKVRKQPENVNAGLLTYPVLMAADIIIHNASKVPVGKDQEQNLEMARKFARRFNNLYKVNYFTEPQAYNFGETLIKIPGLDGTGKMGKSEGNGIYLFDDPKDIRKKVMRAVTDSGPTEMNSEIAEPIQNLFTLMDVVSEKSTIDFFKGKYANCEIRYGDFKKQLAEDIINFTSPIREKILDISANDEYLRKVAKMGAEKARESAAKTVKEVRKIIGFKPFLSTQSIKRNLNVNELHELVKNKIVGKKGVVSFDLQDLTISINTKTNIGAFIKEWFKEWMLKEGVDLKENINLQIKAFEWDKGPQFSLGSFKEYSNSHDKNHNNINTDFLIFAYQKHEDEIAIKNVYIEKIWDITSSSKSLPIKLNGGSIITCKWYSENLVYKPFSTKERFLSALNLLNKHQ